MTVDKKKEKVLNKLAERGFDTERKITRIDMRDVYEQGLADQLGGILELREAIRNKAVIEWLCNGSDEESEAKDDAGTDESEGYYSRGSEEGTTQTGGADPGGDGPFY